MLQFIIDNRESFIKEYFISLSNIPISISFKNLDLGDFIISHNTQPIFIFERKTIKDLAASIKDGRYNEQKKRLFQIDNCKICFIIEDFQCYTNLTENNIISGLSDSIILSSIINNTLLTNFGIFLTKDIHDTCTLLISIINRITNNTQKYTNNSYLEIDTQLTRKSSNILPENIFIHMLAQIPTISIKKAEAIHKLHPTMQDFISKLLEFHDNKNKINYLRNIPIIRKNKEGKLGVKTAEKIVEYLFSF